MSRRLEPFPARYHEPVLSASYTKRKSMASKYIAALRDREATGSAASTGVNFTPDTAPVLRKSAPRETLIRAWPWASRP